MAGADCGHVVSSSTRWLMSGYHALHVLSWVTADDDVATCTMQHVISD